MMTPFTLETLACKKIVRLLFFFSSRRRHTISKRDWSSDVCSSDLIKIVHEELVTTLGGETGKLAMSSKPPTVVMLAGLQGSGKTTAAGKLARLLVAEGRKIGRASCRERGENREGASAVKRNATDKS